MTVAKELIGKTLVRLEYGVFSQMPVRLSGIIVETEAYEHTNDRASHAYKGVTSRNRPMFGDVGRTYIYFIYGSHFCMNISAHSDRVKAGAVLIRAIEPCEGVDVMRRLRSSKNTYGLTSGPGKICQAMNINDSLNSLDVTDPQSEIHIEFDKEITKKNVTTTERIGIRYAAKKKWRFVCGI